MRADFHCAGRGLSRNRGSQHCSAAPYGKELVVLQRRKTWISWQESIYLCPGEFRSWGFHGNDVVLLWQAKGGAVWEGTPCNWKATKSSQTCRDGRMEAVVCSVSTGLRQNRGSFYSPGVGNTETPLPWAVQLLYCSQEAFSPGIIPKGMMKMGKDKSGREENNWRSPRKLF